MKSWKVSSRLLSCGIAALMLVTLLLPLAARAEGDARIVEWRGYVLYADRVTDDPALVKYTDKAKPNARFVKVSFATIGGSVKMDDIVSGFKEFALRDPKGSEYIAQVYGVNSLRIINNKMTVDDYQASFALFFDAPEGIPLDDLTLYVDTDDANEHIIVSLSKVPRE